MQKKNVFEMASLSKFFLTFTSIPTPNIIFSYLSVKEDGTLGPIFAFKSNHYNYQGTIKIYFSSDLARYEEAERQEKETKLLEKLKMEREKTSERAFVEFLSDGQLFQAMFDQDRDGQALLRMGDEMDDVYNE